MANEKFSELALGTVTTIKDAFGLVLLEQGATFKSVSLT